MKALEPLLWSIVCVSWNDLANCFYAQNKKIDQQFLMFSANWSGEAAASVLKDISTYLYWLGANYKKIAHTTDIISEYTQLFNAIRNMIVKPEIVERNRLNLVYYKENLTVLQAANLLGSNEAAIFQCKNYILSLEQEYTTWCTSTSYVLKQYAANMAALQSRLYPFAVLAPIV